MLLLMKRKMRFVASDRFKVATEPSSSSPKIHDTRVWAREYRVFSTMILIKNKFATHPVSGSVATREMTLHLHRSGPEFIFHRYWSILLRYEMIALIEHYCDEKICVRVIVDDAKDVCQNLILTHIFRAMQVCVRMDVVLCSKCMYVP